MRFSAHFARSLLRHGRYFLKDRRGATVLVFSLALIPMLLAAGGAVDFTRYYDAQKNVQTALDAATLAGTAVYDGSNDSTSADTAEKTFTSWSQGFNGSVSNTTFTPSSDSDALYVTGKTKVSLNMYFTALVGIKTLDFTVTSKAERIAGSTSSGGGTCLYALDATSSSSFHINGSGNIYAPNCELNVASTSSSQTVDGTVTASKVCIAGTASMNNKPDNLESPCTDSHIDPYKDTITTPAVGTCQTKITTKVEGTKTLEPGTYCGGLTFQSGANVTFSPGIYIIKGGYFQMEGGTYTGDGVTFYFYDNSSYIHVNDKDTITNFTAPDSGTYKGILMFDNPDITSGSFDVNGNANWSGLIHFPKRTIQFNGSSLTMEDTTIVADGIGVDSKISLANASTTTTAEYGPPRLIR